MLAVVRLHIMFSLLTLWAFSSDFWPFWFVVVLSWPFWFMVILDVIHSFFAPESIRSLELSLPHPFVPWPIRSWLSRSLELCSQVRNGPGTFVPLVHDVDTRYSNYTLLVMRTFSIEGCGTHGLSQTLKRRTCSG